MANRDLEKRLEKIERKVANLERTTYFNVKAGREVKKPKYKVGDYVEYRSYCSPTTNNIKKGKIIYIDSNFVKFDNNEIWHLGNIIGYAEKELEYKVGDYVKYKWGGNIHKGEILTVFKDCYNVSNSSNFECNIFTINKEAILGYAQLDLLTSEEKEYLKVITKPFGRDLLIYRMSNGDIEIDNKDRRLITIDGTFIFKKLKDWKEYTLEELGL